MQRPPPGLQAPPTSLLVQDRYGAPSALLAGVGSHDTGTTVLDNVLPGPALAGGVSVSMPAPGYHYGYAPWVRSVGRAEVSSVDRRGDVDSAYPPVVAAAPVPPESIGYFPDNRRCPPITQTTSVHPQSNTIAASREQAPGKSATSSDTRSDTMRPCTDQLATLVGALQAPKITIPAFNGDPMSYSRFIRAFEHNIERVITDDASRMAHLTQLCQGEAARVIECCVLMPPELGYPQARELLKERFGDEVIIVDMWVKRLVGDTKALPLQEYADNLRACFGALTSMNALAHLDNSTNLPKLVEKLPGYLQSRWRSLALKLRKEKPSRRPALSDLVEFAQDAALEANDPLYGIKPRKSAQLPVVRGASMMIADSHFAAEME